MTILLSLGLGALLGWGLWLLMPASTLPLNRHRTRLFGPLQTLLDEAGFGQFRPESMMGVCAGVGLVAGGMVWFLIPIPALAIIAALASPWGVLWFLFRHRHQRRQRLRLSWPGVIEHLRAGVRSGGDVTGAVLALPLRTLPPELSNAVTSFRQRIESGMPTDAALSELRIDLADPLGDRIVEVLRMAHEVGGTDLPGLLRGLHASIRHDIAIRQDAHARQSWIRSASVLAACAPWVVLVVIGGRGETIEAYQSAAGSALLFLGALTSGVAFFLMRRIGSLPEPRRWLA